MHTLFAYLFCLRSNSLGLVITTANDIVTFDVDDDKKQGLGITI
jgi:hypothetical protein